jgi:hypothetical protein
MAKQTKYDTIEEVVAATGVELNEKTRPFLESFVKKAAGTPGEASVTSSAKKKGLLEQAELFGVKGLDPENENSTMLQVKIITHLFDEGRLEECKEFAAANNLFVTDTGAIHRVKQAIKPIEQRNAGVKEGSVGYNTIQLLKEDEYAGLTASELAVKQAEVFGQTTTAACIQWYINYCHKKKEAALAAGNAELADEFTIAVRQRTARASKAAEGGVVLGAELTLEKASKPRGFQKKATTATLGEQMDLEA